MAALGTTTASATTSSSTIVAANKGRGFLAISNASGTAIWLSFGGTAVVGSGLQLADGDTLIIERASRTEPIYGGAINAIHAGVGSKAVGIEERDTL